MKDYQRDFIRFAIDYGVLRFGDFTLKSGRKSPFFFNAGLFQDGRALAELGRFYASAINDYFSHSNGLSHSVDLLFGPAYKGIPLVSSAALSLYTQYQVNLPYAFNRKEAKDHGEGGSIVGASLDGKRIVVVDDVITAGTAIRESIDLIGRAKDARLVGVVVALDRQEKGKESSLSAIQEIQHQYDVPVICIVSLTDIITYLEQNESTSKEYVSHLVNIKRYRAEYGAAQ